jgi:hypothetical protein
LGNTGIQQCLIWHQHVNDYFSPAIRSSGLDCFIPSETKLDRANLLGTFLEHGGLALLWTWGPIHCPRAAVLATALTHFWTGVSYMIGSLSGSTHIQTPVCIQVYEMYLKFVFIISETKVSRQDHISPSCNAVSQRVMYPSARAVQTWLSARQPESNSSDARQTLDCSPDKKHTYPP